MMKRKRAEQVRVPQVERRSRKDPHRAMAERCARTRDQPEKTLARAGVVRDTAFAEFDMVFDGKNCRLPRNRSHVL